MSETTGQAASDGAATPEGRVRALLGMANNADIDPRAAMALLADSLEALLAIDQVTTATWRQIAPGSSLRAESRLRQRAGDALSGDVGGAGEELESVRTLAVTMLAAVSRAGQVAWRHAARLAPERVEGLARTEKKWNESVEFAAWRRYRDLAGELDAASFETEIMGAIAKYVEDLAAKRRRAAAPPAPPTEPGGSD